MPDKIYRNVIINCSKYSLSKTKNIWGRKFEQRNNFMQETFLSNNGYWCRCTACYLG